MTNLERAVAMRRQLNRAHAHQARAESETCIHCRACGEVWPCEARRDFDGMGEQA